MTSNDKKLSGDVLILLHPDDNVLVSIKPVQAGETLLIDGHSFVSACSLQVGHKLARRAMIRGEKIIKYGAPIGSLTAPVNPGDHVHMHNMQSDYIPSHTRTRQDATRSEA